MEVVFAKCKNIIHDTEITQKNSNNNYNNNNKQSISSEK